MLSGFVLKRLGTEFVERYEREHGVTDTDRLVALARAGQSLVMFPESHLARAPGLRPFHMGAFVVAAQAAAPAVPTGIRGTRAMLRPGHRFPRRGAVTTSPSVSRSSRSAPTGQQQSGCSALHGTPCCAYPGNPTSNDTYRPPLPGRHRTGTVNLSNPRAIFAGSPPRFTRSRVTYEAYVVSRTSTRPQVDSAPPTACSCCSRSERPRDAAPMCRERPGPATAFCLSQAASWSLVACFIQGSGALAYSASRASANRGCGSTHSASTRVASRQYRSFSCCTAPRLVAGHCRSPFPRW